MAEPFGIVAGAIGIASAFSACVECFGYVQQARNFGQDLQTNLLTLDGAQLRLARWGEGVGIYNDPKLGRPSATAQEIQYAKEVLIQILALFAKTSDVSKKYRSNAKPSDDLSIYKLDEMDGAVIELHGKLRDRARGSQKGAGVLKLTSWAIYRKKEFKELLDGILLLIDNLERTFPVPTTETQLLEEDIKVIAQNSKTVDESIRKELIAVISGHRYTNIDVQGKAHTGDSFGVDWNGKVTGNSHTFDSIVIGAGAKAQLGNSFGQKGFWDD
ncbi:hypothetical protein ACN47E_003792 [Coniothyrium glycines]